MYIRLLACAGYRALHRNTKSRIYIYTFHYVKVQQHNLSKY